MYCIYMCGVFLCLICTRSHSLSQHPALFSSVSHFNFNIFTSVSSLVHSFQPIYVANSRRIQLCSAMEHALLPREMRKGYMPDKISTHLSFYLSLFHKHSHSLASFTAYTSHPHPPTYLSLSLTSTPNMPVTSFRFSSSRKTRIFSTSELRTKLKLLPTHTHTNTHLPAHNLHTHSHNHTLTRKWVLAHHHTNSKIFHKHTDAQQHIHRVLFPYLDNKKEKTFFDYWLLSYDLSSFLRPWEFARLNIVEKILLAQRLLELGYLSTHHTCYTCCTPRHRHS